MGRSLALGAMEEGKDVLLRTNLKFNPMLHACIFYVLIHARGAESILDAFILRPLIILMLIPILHLQMHGLVLLMVRARPAHARQDIERDLPVRFRVLDARTLGRQLRRGVITWFLVLERPGRFAAEEEGFEAGVHDAAVETEG